MLFNDQKDGYFNTMDRESYSPGHESSAGFTDSNYGPLPTISPPEATSTGNEMTGIKNIGVSTPLGITGGIQGLQSQIRMGTGHVELAFDGFGHASTREHTPGTYGQDERRAIREIAKAQEVNLSTHASFKMMGMAGENQGNFNREFRKQAVDEVRQAVDFAAETAGGGSVVVHTGEFQRPISEQSWAFDEQGRQIFKGYEDEDEHAVFRVVDDRSGRVIDEVRKDKRVPMTLWMRADSDYVGKYHSVNGDPLSGQRVSIKKGDYVDYWGNKIIDPTDAEHGRVPQYDEKTGRFKVIMADYDFFKEESKEWNMLENERLRRKGLKEMDEYTKVTPEERFLRATLETQEADARGWALRFSVDVKEYKKKLQELREAYNTYEELESKTPDSEKWKLKQEFESRFKKVYSLVPGKYEMPTDALKKEIWEMERTLTYAQETAIGRERQARDSRETQEHIKSAEKFALKEAKKSYADLGMHAYEVTQKKGLQKPVFLAIENLFGDRYGGHISELKNVVQTSRDEMAQRLQVQKGLSEGEARKAAEEHIKVTFDTAHFNMWKKYFQGSDAEFKKWYLKEFEDLAASGMIGNVHYVDNFGYNDDHLAPGQGTIPSEEIRAILKKHGYKGPMILELGGDANLSGQTVNGLMKAWRHMGSPIYSANSQMFGGPTSGLPAQSWTDVNYSYFGQNRSPYFIFGSYSPSNDWTLWSQVPME